MIKDCSALHKRTIPPRLLTVKPLATKLDKNLVLLLQRLGQMNRSDLFTARQIGIANNI